MGLTTSRGFRYPVPAEDPDIPRDIKNLADDVNDQFVSVADFGALPAFGKPGRFAYVADKGRVYVDTGTAWSRVGESADPWQTVVRAAASFSAAPGANTLLPIHGSPVGAAAGNSAATMAGHTFWFNPADRQLANGSAQVRIVALMQTTSPGFSTQNVKLRLVPVTAERTVMTQYVSSVGADVASILWLSVAGNTYNPNTSGNVAAPIAGAYAFAIDAVSTGGFYITAELQVRNP